MLLYKVGVQHLVQDAPVPPLYRAGGRQLVPDVGTRHLVTYTRFLVYNTPGVRCRGVVPRELRTGTVYDTRYRSGTRQDMFGGHLRPL